MTSAPAVATIVATDAVTKLDALETLSRIAGTPVEGARTATPRVALGAGVWAQIDIPKFGEPPPLAIDVYAEAGPDVARDEALALADRLRTDAGWTVHPAFAVV